MRYKEKIISLNNTARKGQYLRIQTRGQPIRYYKIKGKTSKSQARKQYQKLIQTKKNKTKQTKQKIVHEQIKPKRKLSVKESIQYIQKIKKSGSIQKYLRKGISKATIDPTTKITNTLINKITKKLLLPIVNDKQALKLLSTPENFKKLKNRLEYHLTGSNKGKLNLEANTHGKTILKAITETQTAINTTGSKYNKIKNLKNNNWYSQQNIQTNENPTKWKLTIIMRNA